ncbi:MAG: DNA-binding IscR family transcriptional regulator, partial [Pseudohongiellaceae bacterium]
RFAQGQPSSLEWLASEVGLAESTLSVICTKLADAGLVHGLAAGTDTVTLARPPEQISVETVIDVGFRLVDGEAGAPPSELVAGLRAAQRRFAESQHLAEVR